MAARGDHGKKFLSKGLGTTTNQRPVAVKLPPEMDEYVRALPNKSEWLREAIREKIEREQNLIAS